MRNLSGNIRIHTPPILKVRSPSRPLRCSLARRGPIQDGGLYSAWNVLGGRASSSGPALVPHTEDLSVPIRFQMRALSGNIIKDNPRITKGWPAIAPVQSGSEMPQPRWWSVFRRDCVKEKGFLFGNTPVLHTEDLSVTIQCQMRALSGNIRKHTSHVTKVGPLSRPSPVVRH